MTFSKLGNQHKQSFLPVISWVEHIYINLSTAKSNKYFNHKPHHKLPENMFFSVQMQDLLTLKKNSETLFLAFVKDVNNPIKMKTNFI